MNEINLSDFLGSLNSEFPEDLLPKIQEMLAANPQKVVVIDDDPTGSQNVRNIPVLTSWNVEHILEELNNDLPAFFILTNSRGLTADEAIEINYQIGKNLRLATEKNGKKISLISRSDSTLRGHFPDEVDALKEGFHQPLDATFIIPALFGGGRYTVDDVHYIANGETLVPVGESEYARDATFGYHSSNIKSWVEEKSRGVIKAREVESISLSLIRQGGPEAVFQQIKTLPKGCICVVNSVSRSDLDVFTLGMLMAEQAGKKFICRTGPSFVPVRIGLAPYPLMTGEDFSFRDRTKGGLVIVGSYVPNTTRQVKALLSSDLTSNLEVEVTSLLNEETRPTLEDDLAEKASSLIKVGKDVLLYTSRNLLTGDTPTDSLKIGQVVSQSLITILDKITVQPRYIVAKGGITSSDVATKGLRVNRGMVLGQIVKGISVWQLGPESRFKDMVYIVFPGNVGQEDSLVDVVTKLK